MTQTLTGLDIGQASYATRAVLDRLLAETGTEFTTWVTLNVLGSNGSVLDRADLVARLVNGLKVDENTVNTTISKVTALGLTEQKDEAIALTAAGVARYELIRAGVARITERLYGGLPAEDLVAAHRMLVEVTARANAELARGSGA